MTGERVNFCHMIYLVSDPNNFLQSPLALCGRSGLRWMSARSTHVVT